MWALELWYLTLEVWHGQVYLTFDIIYYLLSDILEFFCGRLGKSSSRHVSWYHLPQSLKTIQVMLYLSTLYAKFISAINYLINDGDIICIIQCVCIYIYTSCLRTVVLWLCGSATAWLPQPTSPERIFKCGKWQPCCSTTITR